MEFLFFTVKGSASQTPPPHTHTLHPLVTSIYTATFTIFFFLILPYTSLFPSFSTLVKKGGNLYGLVTAPPLLQGGVRWEMYLPDGEGGVSKQFCDEDLNFIKLGL